MENEQNRPRRGWVAVVLALVNPALTMLYVGRAPRAAVYFVLQFLPIVAAFLLSRSGSWPAGVSWIPLIPVVNLVGAVDGYRIAKAHETTFEGPWFSRWQILVASFGVVMASILGIRVLLVEPFRAPSGSMLPTLHEGDQFFVSKLLLNRAPLERGDIITFWLRGHDVMYVKRVIGLPGDVVVYDQRSKRLTINGTEAVVEPVGPYEDEPNLDIVRETIGSRSHLQAYMRRQSSRGGTYRVPSGAYFVLGDNRDNSRDSRFEGVEFIPAADVVGKVLYIWWNTSEPDRAGIVPE